MYKVGIGQDSHPFDHNQKPLVLGGIVIRSSGGLKANSDGDVILHSLCNALSSAIGGDSLGTWADEMCLKQGIKDSRKYAVFILEKVKKAGYKVGNVSISVEAKKPRLSLDQIKKIKKSTAEILEINIACVGLTFTSGEDLTAFGQGKAIQAFSMVTLSND